MCGPARGAKLILRNLSMRFAGQRQALFEIADLDIAAGSRVGINGPSGAGKTTLMHCLAGIAAPSGGTICWNGVDIVRLPAKQRDSWRCRELGLIFQDFHLIEGLSTLDNILLPACFSAWQPGREVRERAHDLLVAVGLQDAARRPAAQLSRGERQRVACARALLMQPGIVMADEPTASLDPDHRAQIGELLLELVRAHGATLLLISHEQDLLAHMDRCLTLRAGSLSDVVRAPTAGVQVKSS